MSPKQIQRWSLLYLITTLWGVATFWISPHLPLTDLPQHAGQITLLKDMLLGQSKWSELFDINLLTPYLTTYALAVLLSFVVSVSTAFKILLSIGYIAFIHMCMRLRKHFEVDSRIDWLFILPFFGFAYQYGFVSFVISAPIGLWFILLADQHAQNQTKLNAITLAAVGLLLLESHGLMFLFSFGVGCLILLSRTKKIASLLRGLVPYLAIFGAFTIIFMVNLKVNTQLGIADYTLKSNDNGIKLIDFLTKALSELKLRLPQAFFYNLAGSKISIYPLIHIPVTLTLLLSPWLLGLRINWRNKSVLIFFTALVVLFIFVPGYTFGTYFVYQRFAILIIPSYALLFTKTSMSSSCLSQPNLMQAATLPLLLIACWTVLAFNSTCAWNFKRESADIDSIINTLQPGHKALSVIYDPISRANNNSLAYAAYPQWYQAEKHGLVYENFAIFAPMPVRFKPGKIYNVFDGADMYSFNWKKHHGENYRYFLVRKPDTGHLEREIPKDLFQGAPCQPKVFAKKGQWTVYEQLPCPQ